MGARIPPEAQPQQPGQGGGGQAAELVANVSSGLEAVAQMVGGQFGEEAGQAILGLQQQFQQVMMQIGRQGGQRPMPGGEAGAAQGAIPENPQIPQ